MSIGYKISAYLVAAFFYLLGSLAPAPNQMVYLFLPTVFVLIVLIDGATAAIVRAIKETKSA